MRVLTEGEGWRKPSELDICRVIYRPLATAAPPADDDDRVSTEVLRIGQSELGPGVDQAIKEMKQGSKVILTLAPRNASTVYFTPISMISRSSFCCSSKRLEFTLYPAQIF